MIAVVRKGGEKLINEVADKSSQRKRYGSSLSHVWKIRWWSGQGLMGAKNWEEERRHIL